MRDSKPGRAYREAVLAILLGISLFIGPQASTQARDAGRELVVFEAASLKDVFARLVQRFENDHPGVKVVTNAAGSQELRAQIEQGAAADVFASADRKQMDAIAMQGLVASSSVLTTCRPP